MKIVERCEGTEYLFKTEQLRGVRAAQEHINRLLSSPDYRPIGDELMELFTRSIQQSTCFSGPCRWLCTLYLSLLGSA